MVAIRASVCKAIGYRPQSRMFTFLMDMNYYDFYFVTIASQLDDVSLVTENPDPGQ